MELHTPEPRAPLDAADVAAHYDDLDPFYRALWGEHLHHGLFDAPGLTPDEATHRLTTLVARRAGVGEGSRVCDVGCGYGATARVLSRDYRARVTALTISRAQLDHARQIDPDGDNPRYLLRDWLHNDLEPESFDAVIAVESSEHMVDLGLFFDEAARVLRPGGRLVVCAWLTRGTLRDWERRWLIGPICREGRLRGMETRETYERLARGAGLMTTESLDLSRQVRASWAIGTRRLVGAFFRDPASRRFLLREGGPNRVFAYTVPRIWLAYRSGAMRYGVLTFEKRAAGESAGTASAG